MANKSPARIPKTALRQHEPEQLITFRVSVLSQLLSRVVETAVSGELGLSSRQWRVLVMLNRLGSSTSGQVATATHLDHSQVSRASYELTDKGLIAMQIDPVDRRKQTLSVTAAGVEVLRRGIVGSQQRQARLQGCLSADELAIFGDALNRLTEEARSMLMDARDTH